MDICVACHVPKHPQWSYKVLSKKTALSLSADVASRVNMNDKKKYLYRILWGMSIDMYIFKCIPIFLSTVGWNIFCLVSLTCPGLSQGRPWSVKQRKPRSERRSLELSSGQMHGHIVQWSFLVYSANWGVICYLPPIKGTRKLHWYCRYHLWPYDILFAVFFF